MNELHKIEFKSVINHPISAKKKSSLQQYKFLDNTVHMTSSQPTTNT